MNAVVVLEHRFVRTPDGRVWTDGPFSYPFFLRYLTTFESVRVAARVTESAAGRKNWARADGAGVPFFAMPYYVGPWQYLLRSCGIRHAARWAIRSTDAVILRVPSQLAICVAAGLRRKGQPFGLEVVGDPLDAFAPGSHPHPLRPLFRRYHYRRLRRQCSRACAVSYVTAAFLQRRYPAASGAFTTHYSSVELGEEAFVRTPRRCGRRRSPFRLITAGSLEHLYKGPDILIEAIASCVRAGLDVRLTVAGDGRRRAELEARVSRLGLEKRIRFAGQLPAGDAVRAALDRADLFVLASRQEGLPRAMIEAMARALPCVGTNVGGIPELLPVADRVPPNDAARLARKIREILSAPQRLEAMSSRNFVKAREYQEEVLRPRRDRYYRYVKQQTRAWQTGLPPTVDHQYSVQREPSNVQM